MHQSISDFPKYCNTLRCNREVNGSTTPPIENVHGFAQKNGVPLLITVIAEYEKAGRKDITILPEKDY